MFAFEFDAAQITAIAVAIIAMIVIIGLFVYNYLTGIQVKTLKSIDKKLDIKEEQQPDADAASLTDAACADEGDSEAENDKNRSGINGAEPQEHEYREIADMLYNVGKSGREYTKEELEMQIRD